MVVHSLLLFRRKPVQGKGLTVNQAADRLNGVQTGKATGLRPKAATS